MAKSADYPVNPTDKYWRLRGKLSEGTRREMGLLDFEKFTFDENRNINSKDKAETLQHMNIFLEKFLAWTTTLHELKTQSDDYLKKQEQDVFMSLFALPYDLASHKNPQFELKGERGIVDKMEIFMGGALKGRTPQNIAEWDRRIKESDDMMPEHLYQDAQKTNEHFKEYDAWRAQLFDLHKASFVFKMKSNQPQLTKKTIVGEKLASEEDVKLYDATMLFLALSQDRANKKGSMIDTSLASTMHARTVMLKNLNEFKKELYKGKKPGQDALTDSIYKDAVNHVTAALQKNINKDNLALSHGLAELLDKSTKLLKGEPVNSKDMLKDIKAVKQKDARSFLQKIVAYCRRGKSTLLTFAKQQQQKPSKTGAVKPDASVKDNEPPRTGPSMRRR